MTYRGAGSKQSTVFAPGLAVELLVLFKAMQMHISLELPFLRRYHWIQSMTWICRVSMSGALYWHLGQ